MNTESSSLPPVALIAGPTASGKSAIAIRLAERTGGVIINADASQVYRDLRILSARPTPEEEALTQHRLFGHVDGADTCSAADWAADARVCIAEAHVASRLPILVGGTGLYLRTLIDGIAPVPPIEPDVRTTVRGLPVEQAYSALCVEDAAAAARLNPADSSRIARALEVVRSTGRTLADWQAERTGGIGSSVRIAGIILLPPREWLRERCDTRFAAMLDRGAIGEVEHLLNRNLPPDRPVMRAIGVAEIAAFIRGEIDKDEMIARASAATRQYAKRQYTWFRHQPPAHWRQYIEQLDDSITDKLVILLHNNVLTA